MIQFAQNNNKDVHVNCYVSYITTHKERILADILALTLIVH